MHGIYAARNFKLLKLWFEYICTESKLIIGINIYTSSIITLVFALLMLFGVTYCYFSSELSLATGCKPKEPKKPNPMGDMAIKDLPPVPDLSTLSIHVDERECVHMGNISAVVDEFGKMMIRYFFTLTKFLNSATNRRTQIIICTYYELWLHL